MSPAFTALLILVALYILGRAIERAGHQTRRALNPSRLEHVVDEYDTSDDEGMDTFAAIWNDAFDVDELERLWELPARSHA